MNKKRPPFREVLRNLSDESHEVVNFNATIVAVGGCLEASQSLSGSFCEWVSDHAVAGLESNLGLEGVLTNGTNHLERNIRAVEQTSVIRGRTLITSNEVLRSSTVSRIRIDVDAILTLQNTSEGVTGVINVQVSVQSRSVVQNTSHGQSRGNICRAEDHVALSATSSLGDSICFALDLEKQTFELLNRPATIGVNVEVEYAAASNVCLGACFSSLVDGTDNLTVDLSKNLGAKDISEFCFSVQTVDALRSWASSSEYSPSVL